VVNLQRIRIGFTTHYTQTAAPQAIRQYTARHRRLRNTSISMTFPILRHLLSLTLSLVLLAGAGHALAQTGSTAPTVTLSAETRQTAPNDLAMASVFFEADGPNPASLSRTVDAAIEAGLAEIRRYPDIKAKTGSVSTSPTYGKGTRRIDGWRMRSEILLESRNLTALSELIGKLQSTLSVSRLSLQPAPETRSAAADLAAIDAIRAFEARAKMVSSALGMRYRIRDLAISYAGHHPPVVPMMRATAFATEAVSAPIEAGESEIIVSISGTIELID
jgi:predicted secreted protein